MKRIPKLFLIFGVVVIALILLDVRLISKLHSVPPAPRTVATHTGDVTVSVTETGSISAADMVSVKSKVAGRVLSLPIEEGQYVTKGQLIATVDRTQLDPQIAITRAQLDEARARLDQSVASYRLQQVQTKTAIDQAQASLRTAEAHLASVKAGTRPQQIAQEQDAVSRDQITLADAKRTLARRQTLLARGFIAQSDADAAQVAVDTAAASLAAEQQQLALLQAGPRSVDVDEAQAQVAASRVQLAAAKAQAVQDEVRKSDIVQAQAGVTQINNQLQQLLVQLGDTTIVAPSSGTVLKKYKEVNEIVQSATTGFTDAESNICVLGNQPMVNVNVNEIDLPNVRVGAPVRVTVDAIPGVVFPARVESIAPVSSNSMTSSGGGTQAQGSSSVSEFPVKIRFVRPDARLRPGMTASTEIISAERKSVLLAPLEAIPFSGDKGTVTVLGPGNSQVKRQVTLRLRDDTDAEVASGLQPGDKLVINKIDGSDRRKINISDGPD